MREHLHNQAEHNLPAQQQPSDLTLQITAKSRRHNEGHTPPPAKGDLRASNGVLDVFQTGGAVLHMFENDHTPQVYLDDV